MLASEIATLSPREFVELVARLFTKMGFAIAAPSEAIRDHVDFVAHASAEIVRGRYFVQCKHQTQPIADAAVRQLHALVGAEGAVKGILVTNAAFTTDSREFASGRALELIDGVRLRELLATHVPGATPTEASFVWRLPPHFEPLCRRASLLLDPLWTEWDALQQVQAMRTLPASEQTYRDLVAAQVQEIGELVVTLSGVIESPMSSEQEAEKVASSLAAGVRRLLDLHRIAASADPPSGFAPIHAALLAVHDDLLSAVRRFHRGMVAFLEDPTQQIDAEGRFVLAVDFTSPGMNRLSQLVSEMRARAQE